MLPQADRAGAVDGERLAAFVTHPLHGVLRTLSTLRPPLDIAVT